MVSDFHHAHLFAADLDAAVAWYVEMLGGVVAYDGDFGGARNVFMRLGTGRLHLYDQPPRGQPGGALHHLGFRSDNLSELVAHMEARGVSFRGSIREFGHWRYIMCMAPDQVLLELFEVDSGQMPPELAEYFPPL